MNIRYGKIIQFLVICLLVSFLENLRLTLADIGLSGNETGDSADLIACPCRLSTHRDYNNKVIYEKALNQIHVLCLINDAISEELFSHYSPQLMNVNMHLISEHAAEELLNSSLRNLKSNCSGIIRFIHHSKQENDEVFLLKRKCPGRCLPLPFTEIPIHWLLPPFDTNHPVLCSLTQSGIWESFEKHGHHHRRENVSVDASPTIEHLLGGSPAGTAAAIGHLLGAIARRRIEECTERGRWPLTSFIPHKNTSNKSWTNESYLLPHKSFYPRRVVYGLIVWIGTTSKLSLAEHQYEVLRQQNQDRNDSEKIFGWIATEDQYPCRVTAPLNKTVRVCPQQFAHHHMLPATKLGHADVIHSGWACAQRRPLRALAHVLLLYDPQFILLVDDDTWVNMKILEYGSPLSRLITTTMLHDALVLGQLNGGNKVTKSGFFYGGAGYLMSKGLLDVLDGYTLVGPDPWGDTYRDNKQLAHLGLMEVAVEELSKGGCPGPCLSLNPNITLLPHFVSNTAQLKVRLVDLCATLMSDEGTCYHSDHSLSRCLIHGAYASVWDVKCQGWKIPKSDPPAYTHMCMGLANCSSPVLTCHRWVANVSDPGLNPIDVTIWQRAQG